MSLTANHLFKTILDLLDSYDGIIVLSASPGVSCDGDYGVLLMVKEEFLELWLKIMSAFLYSNPDPSKIMIGFYDEFQTTPVEGYRIFAVRMLFRDNCAKDFAKSSFFENCIARLRHFTPC